MELKKVIGWSITERCNQKCKHCYVGKKNLRDVTTEEAKRVIDQLKSIGVHGINFGGGEPSLHPQFRRIVEMVHKEGIKMSLTTNGIKYDLYSDFLELFNDIGVSIHFPESEKHDELCKRSGSFNLATNNLEAMVQLGIRTEIVTAIMQTNYGEMNRMYELAKKIGVNFLRLNRLRPKYHLPNKELICSPEELQIAYQQLEPYTRGKPQTSSDPSFLSFLGVKGLQDGCPCGKTSFRIKVNGDVTPCVFYDGVVGNILQKDISDIICNPEFTEFIQHDKHGCSSYIINSCLNKDDGQFNRERHMQVTEGEHLHQYYLGTIMIPIK